MERLDLNLRSGNLSDKRFFELETVCDLFTAEKGEYQEPCILVVTYGEKLKIQFGENSPGFYSYKDISRQDSLCLDYGQKWLVHNLGELLASIGKEIAGRDDIQKAILRSL